MQKLYINGEWVESKSGKAFDVINPATNELIDRVASAGIEDTIDSIDAAEEAFRKWRNVLPKDRSKILRKFYDSMIQNREDLARLIVVEQGKSIHDARIEVDYAASFVEWFSEEAKRIYGDIVPSTKVGQTLLNYKEPIGVVAAITPWNFPAAMITRKIAPAIAAGCTVIVKPSEETPLTAFYLAKLLEESGLPKGVFNIICGNAAEIGNTLTESKKVRMLTFTGSTIIGKMLYAKSANTVKKVTLELGGNAPFIAFDDADIALAVQGLISSKLRAGGQSCICVNRVFVHENIASEFANAIVDEFKKIKVGNGLDESVTLGPLINKAANIKISKMINDAVNKGSSILFKSDAEGLNENFCLPTVIMNINDTSLLYESEIFAPVVSIFTFQDEEDVIARANNTQYGLASYIYTEDRKRIDRVVNALEYGMIGVNNVTISTEMTSFGGIKESGLGREGGKYGILEYLEDKFVAIN